MQRSCTFFRKCKSISTGSTSLDREFVGIVPTNCSLPDFHTKVCFNRDNLIQSYLLITVNILSNICWDNGIMITVYFSFFNLLSLKSLLINTTIMLSYYPGLSPL